MINDYHQRSLVIIVIDHAMEQGWRLCFFLQAWGYCVLNQRQAMLWLPSQLGAAIR
jgi:hypothetical protein